MDRSLRAKLNSFFEKVSDLSDRAIKHWPLPKSAKDAELDADIGYEFKEIVTKEDLSLDENKNLINSFFTDLYASGHPFNHKITQLYKNRTRDEIEAAIASKNPFKQSSGATNQPFQAYTLLLIGHVPGEETARAGCVLQYFHCSQTIFIESIWLADELQQHIRKISSNQVELVVDGLESEAEDVDEKIRQLNREQNQQTVLSWMLTYRNSERGKQSALLNLLKNHAVNPIEGVFIEVQNPTALVMTCQCDKDVLTQAAKRLTAFHAIEARYLKFAYERPNRLSETIGDRSCFLLTLPQIHGRNGELVVESAVVMKFIIDYGKSLLGNAYADDPYRKDWNVCDKFYPNKYTALLRLGNDTDAIARNNKSLFENRLSEHKTLLYLHSIPRLENPRFTYRRSSVGFEILVDEDYFEPIGLDPYHDMVPPEPQRTPLGNWLAIVWKELVPPKHGVPKALYCPVAHSGETDLFAYKYQAEPPYYTRYYSINQGRVNVEFPSHFEFTSEGRMENFYRLPETDERLIETKKQRDEVEQSIEKRDALPQFTYTVQMDACVSYTYFLKSAVRVWHLVLKPISDDVSELEIIKLMRFFSGSQEHEDEEERRESVRRIRFSVQGTEQKAEPISTFREFIRRNVSYPEFQPAINYHGAEERKLQKKVWKVKTFGLITLWVGLGILILWAFLFTLPSLLKWSPIGIFPTGQSNATLTDPTVRLGQVTRAGEWSNMLLSAIYWLTGFLILRKVWRWLFNTLANFIGEGYQFVKKRSLRLFIIPDETQTNKEEPDNLIKLLHDLTGVYYKRNKNSQLQRQMDKADQVVTLRNVRSGVVEIDTGDVSPVPEKADENDVEIDAASFLGFYNNGIQSKPYTVSTEADEPIARIPLSKRNEIRAQVKDLYKKLYEGDIQMEDDPEPFTVEEYADYVFKSYCGICLGIFDYDRMGFQEIDDTLVPLADSKTEDSFMVIHRGVLAMLGHDDDVMDTFWNTLGTNAYLLIPSAVLAHNDMVSRDADTLLDKLLKDLREGRSQLSVRLLNMERNHIDDLLNDDVLGNVFQYKTEQEIYEQGMKRRGITDRMKDARSKLEQLEKLINEKQEAGSTRYQRRITFLATLVGIFSFYEYVRNYFQNELAMEDPANSKIKLIDYKEIPLLFKIPAKLIDHINERMHIIPQILPHEGCYDPLYLSHVVITFLFVLLIGYLLILNIADPGRNKKYFWQRATTRYRSLPKTNVSTPKTR